MTGVSPHKNTHPVEGKEHRRSRFGNGCAAQVWRRHELVSYKQLAIWSRACGGSFTPGASDTQSLLTLLMFLVSNGVHLIKPSKSTHIVYKWPTYTFEHRVSITSRTSSRENRETQIYVKKAMAAMRVMRVSCSALLLEWRNAAVPMSRTDTSKRTSLLRNSWKLIANNWPLLRRA